MFEALYQEELYAFSAPVVVVVPTPWSAIAAEHKAVLAKMLVAVRLSIDTVQIVTRQDFTLEELAPLQSVKVLAFGANLKSPAALYQHHALNGTSLIVADSLDQLDDLKKKNLWLALRQMFGI
jgi:hypothetical protein